MGIFSSNRLLNENYEVRVIPGYEDGYYSAQQAMLESNQNEMILFEAAIMSDIEEAYMVHNDVDKEEIMAYTENVLTDMLDKIKEFIMKAWEKIKAIFKGWMAKLDSVMMKSNKEFVNKYKDTVLKKDLTDMEVKWRKPLKTLSQIKDFNPGATVNNLNTTTHTDPQASLDKWDEDDELCKILNGSLDTKVSDPKDYEKEFIDEYLDDEDTDDKIDIHTIMSELLTFKDTKKGADKANKSLNKELSKMVKEIEKDQSKFAKAMPGTGPEWGTGADSEKYTFKTRDGSDLKNRSYSYSFDKSNNSWSHTATDTGISILTGTHTGGSAKYDDEKHNPIKKYQKALNLVYKHAVLHQKAANMYTAAVMKLFKLYNSQLRMVWAKAVAYSRKEESVMTEAMMELAQYEEIYI